MIHPTAIVDPGALLAADVEVGPWAMIEAGARLGPRCRVLAHAIIKSHVQIGADNEIGYGAVIGADPQDLSFVSGTQSHVVIGNNNVIREYVTIHRGTAHGSQTIIGDHNFLMVGVHLGHNVIIGNHVIIVNNCLLAGHVTVDDRAFLGGGAVFHQGIRIGTLAMVRGGSRISKNIPPYLLAYESDLVSGLNNVGLRRSGMSASTRAELKKAFQSIYRSGHNITQALEAAAQQNWSSEAQHFFEVIALSKKRGVCSIDARTYLPLQEREES